MWIFSNDSFLSIVAHPKQPGHLLVRARRAGDIKVIFPDYPIEHNTGTDYPYRATIPRYEVAEAMVRRVTDIDYSNFKDSIPGSDGGRYSTYTTVWATLFQLEGGPPEIPHD